MLHLGVRQGFRIRVYPCMRHADTIESIDPVVHGFLSEFLFKDCFQDTLIRCAVNSGQETRVSGKLGHICRFAYVDPELLVAGSNREIAVRRMKRLIGRIPRVCGTQLRSEEHTSELQSLMRHSYAVFSLKKKNNKPN